MSGKNLRPLLFLFFSYFMLATTTRGQANEESIKLIRSMYAAVNDFQKAGAGYDCKNGSIRTKSPVDYSKGYYTQRANRCSYPTGYSKLNLNFEEWEWAVDGEYYYKNRKLFFVYLVENTVCGTRTYRLYYDKSGALIRLLEHIEDCSDDVQGKNNEVYNESAIRRISGNANSHLRKALSIMN